MEANNDQETNDSIVKVGEEMADSLKAAIEDVDRWSKKIQMLLPGDLLILKYSDETIVAMIVENYEYNRFSIVSVDGGHVMTPWQDGIAVLIDFLSKDFEVSIVKKDTEVTFEK